MESDLRAERDYWRDVACYLADCHAATAGYDGDLKSVSRARKERFASIANTAGQALLGNFSKRSNVRAPEEVAKRCIEAAERIRGA
jgi:hypothetical protein